MELRALGVVLCNPRRFDASQKDREVRKVGMSAILDWKIARSFLAACTFLIPANLGLICFLEFTPKISRAIAPSDIQSELGLAYQVSEGMAGSRLYRLVTDSGKAPISSNFELIEDDHPFGIAHSVHADIRAKGGGRYSFWDGKLIFSTIDGTDPRTNGRAYSFVSSTAVKPWLRLLLLAILALADAAFAKSFKREILFHLRAHGGVIVGTGIGGSLVLLAGLASSDLFSPIVVANAGLPKDAAFALSVFMHAVLGCLTSVGFWAAGAGISKLTSRNRHSDLARILIPAMPIGMAVLAALLAIALLAPWGRFIAFALWVTCLLPLADWRPPSLQVVAALKAALGIIPFAIAFGIWQALLWHGPTDTLSGTPTGDLTFYVGSIWSLAIEPLPYLDFGFANGELRGYFNSLYPALGATLLHLPDFDPFLFLLASGGTSYVLLTALMLCIYLTDRAARTLVFPDILILTLSIVVAARYPYWVAESPPLVFVPALTISVWWMSERGRHDYRWGIAAGLAGLSGSFLSKIVSAATLVPLGFAGFLPRVERAPWAIKLAALAIAGVFGIYSAAMLTHFIPLFAGFSHLGTESIRLPHWYFTLRDIGALLIVASGWLVAEASIALALTLGMATFLAYSWLFQINFVCVSIALGLILTSGRSPSIYGRRLALTAFVLSLPALFLSDQASASSGVVWICCVGGAVLVAILNAQKLPSVPQQLTFRNSMLLAMFGFAVIGLGLIGVSRGSIIVDLGWSSTLNVTLTPALREIWSAVRERTPKDALIFTDQVDETENALGGWNTYAYSGQRQIYLSSYVTNNRLRNKGKELEDILTVNKAVLDGSRLPQNVPTQRRYGSFYAVVSITKSIPENWKLITKNSQYALFQIGG